MHRSETPLTYRRNAISIAPETIRNGPGCINDKSSDNHLRSGDQSRVMSLTDETSDPRLRKILSRFSLNPDEEGNGGSRLTGAQINGTMERCFMICYRSKTFMKRTIL